MPGQLNKPSAALGLLCPNAAVDAHQEIPASTNVLRSGLANKHQSELKA